MLPSLLLPLSLFTAVSCTNLHWKDYLVTNPLPNVTYPLPRNFAGNVPVNRDNHPNNTLFFWAFENTPGSLTAPQNSSQEPWIIWLNGGPGSSSFIGLMTENGPLRVTGDYSIVDNAYSWDKLADIVYVDINLSELNIPRRTLVQTVHSIFSYSRKSRAQSSIVLAADENQVGEDFIGFLSNLVYIFPSLATRPLYLTGESYAGVYIPYITKAIFSTPHPPVTLKKIAIGDGAIGEYPTSGGITVLDIIATYPQLIGYDAEVFEYFQTQYQLCGYDFELTYPPTGPLPYLFDPIYQDSPSDNLRRRSLDSGWSAVFSRGREVSILKREQEERRNAWKRDLSGRPNGTLDPYYGCFLLIELQDYAANYSFPFDLGGLNPYDVTSALQPPIPADASIFLNDPRTRAAIHAPSGKIWKKSVDLNWTGTATPNFQGDPSPLPITFLSELAANASKHDVGIVLYVGNDDLLVAHRGIEAVIQNFTFGGIQGFTRKPDTPFTDDHGRFSGIIHQERNVTYALFANAGHYVPESVPEAAFVFLREFILGSNLTGFVDSPTSPAVGGDSPELASNILPGNSAIFYGSGTTASSTVAPEATIAAWNSFIATATLSASATSA